MATFTPFTLFVELAKPWYLAWTTNKIVEKIGPTYEKAGPLMFLEPVGGLPNIPGC